MSNREYEITKSNNNKNKDNTLPILLIVGGAVLIATGAALPIGLILLIFGVEKLGKNKEENVKRTQEVSTSRYYAEKLIPAMRNAFGERFMVERKAGISLEHVWKSGLFVRQPNCERHGIAGANYRGVDAKIGWIETFRIEQRKDSAGKFHYDRADRFRGVLLMIQTKQTAPCAFKILGKDYPDKGELCDPGMFRMIPEDKGLDENFILLTDNARALETMLTPENSQAITRLMELCGNRKFAISWRGHLCYAAWDSYSNQLDLPVALDAEGEIDFADRAVYYITDFVDTCGAFIW